MLEFPAFSNTIDISKEDKTNKEMTDRAWRLAGESRYCSSSNRAVVT